MRHRLRTRTRLLVAGTVAMAAALLASCSVLGSLLYKADIKGEKAAITFESLNGVKQEKITLNDTYLFANLEASNQRGSLSVTLKWPDGRPLASFVLGAKESTKIEQIGPFPKGTYLIEIRGQSAGKGSIKVTFS